MASKKLNQLEKDLQILTEQMKEMAGMLEYAVAEATRYKAENEQLRMNAIRTALAQQGVSDEA